MKPIHKNAAREEVRKPDVAWLRVGRVEPVPVVVGHGDVKEQNCRAGAGIARSLNTEPGLGTCCRDFWSCRQHSVSSRQTLKGGGVAQVALTMSGSVLPSCSDSLRSHRRA